MGVENRSQIDRGTGATLFNPPQTSTTTRQGSLGKLDSVAQLSAGEEKMLVID